MDYCNLNDKELIKLCQGNKCCDKYIEILIKRYTPLIHNRAFKFKNDRVSTEDLQQECIFALYKAVKCFNLNSDSSFAAYASATIDNRMINICKKYSNVNTEILTDKEFEITDEITPESIFLQKDFVDYISKRLDKFDAEVFEMYLNGCSYKEMAEKKDVSTKFIDNTIQRIRKKLKLEIQL